MMLSECPHCYARVVPKADGRCPACQKDMRDLTGVDPTKASLRVAQGDVLPSICCDCGQATQRVVTVCRKRTARDEPSTWVKILLLITFNWGSMSGLSSRDVVEVELPQCELCGSEGRPEPVYVDFDNVRMTFVVHKNLRDASTP